MRMMICRGPVAVMLILVCASASDGKYGGGSGLPDDPFLIYTAEQFNTIGANVDDWDKHFKLMNDVDLQDVSEKGIKVIGYPGLYSPLAVVIDGAAGKLYWTESATGRIQRANLDGSKVEDVVTNLSTPFGIALDGPREKLYWTDLGSDKIQRAGLDGSQVEDVIATGLGTPRGIALAGDKIYWTDSGQHTLCRADLDGSNIETLVSVGLDRPMGVTVDSSRGRIYWADADTGKIQKANLDGTHVMDVVSNGLDRPTGIAVDAANSRIYWSDWGLDRIQSAALDGTDVRDIASTGLMTPYLMAIDVDTGHLYWADRDSVKIQRADLGGSRLRDVIVQNPPFSGVFDGNEKTLFNFSLLCTGQSQIGLFGHIRGPEAQIRNLTLAKPSLDVMGAGAAGILVGQLEAGAVVGCNITEGVIIAGGDAGGLVGDNHGTVEGCSVTITATGASGLVAENLGTLSNCQVWADVSRGSGLVGSNSGKIEGCHVCVNVDRGSGLVGTNRGTVTTSDAQGEVRGRSNIGGLIGTNKGVVTFSCAHVAVNATGQSIGGLVGHNESKIAYCYTQGDVTGLEKVAGLVGVNEGAIHQCYAASAVSGGADVGGLVADGNGVSQSFWDVAVSGQAFSTGGEGHGTVEMQSIDLYAAAGWDFVGPQDGPSDIWALPEYAGYPLLWWQLTDLPELPSFAGGTGHADAPYLIATAEQLSNIGCNPRLMKVAFALTHDIDLSQRTFHPIGSDVMPFAGRFGGNGHSISGMSLTGSWTDHIGMFGSLSGVKSEICDLFLIQPEMVVEEGDCIGAIAGEVIEGSVVRCHVQEGRINASDNVGGLIGGSYHGDVADCHFSGTVVGTTCVGGLIGQVVGGDVCDSSSECSIFASEIAGGLVGKNTGGRISRSHTMGQVAGASVLGGLIGENDGTVQDCYAESSVKGIDDTGRDAGGLVGLNSVAGIVNTSCATGKVVGNECVGGLCGENGGDVMKCYAITDSAGLEQVGGLVGWNFSGALSMCFSDGVVEGQSCIGGLVGDNSGLCFHICFAGGAIVDCYSQCVVTGGDTVGGLAGRNGGYRLGDEGTILRCYASSIINGTSNSVGGLVALGSAVNSFWDMEKSGLAYSAGGSGKTTLQMRTAETFVEAGWDLTNESRYDTIWHIQEGQDYPRLQWERE